MSGATIDRERIGITARSVLANLEQLEGDGLDDATRREVEQLARRLDDRTVDDSSAVELAGQLRSLLARDPRHTAQTWVAWIDDALSREQQAG